MNNTENLDNLAETLYDKLKDQKSITPILVQRHAHVDFETAMRICEKIWRKLREDAQKWALEVIAR